MIIQGDCETELKKLPENSVDACATDPPYGLTSIVKRFGKEGSAPAQHGKDGSFARLSGGFMGKKWDGAGIEYNLDMWREVLRVVKPGGHLLSFGGSRTYHRMACAIEDAGFEIRDQIMWVYGSGFPKSLNIGKAVDKLQGNEREIIGKQTNLAVGTDTTMVKGSWGSGSPESISITKGTSDWEGYGTALKPAHEPIVLARKPLSEKTVAENVLKWGVGGLAIDNCRVATNEKLSIGSNKHEGNAVNFGMKDNKEAQQQNPKGRFPANFIHDGSQQVVDLFPDTGQKGKCYNYSGQKEYQVKGFIPDNKPNSPSNRGDSGSAARFFYCAKASKRERQGSTHPTMKPIALMKYLVTLISREGQTVLDPFMGSGTTGIACKELNRNFIGIEMDKTYCEIAKNRMNKL